MLFSAREKNSCTETEAIFVALASERGKNESGEQERRQRGAKRDVTEKSFNLAKRLVILMSPTTNDLANTRCLMIFKL